jgi:hypothetical protein
MSVSHDSKSPKIGKVALLTMLSTALVSGSMRPSLIRKPSDVLTYLVNLWPASHLDELMPTDLPKAYHVSHGNPFA